jgi:hypothetical protein
MEHTFAAAVGLLMMLILQQQSVSHVLPLQLLPVPLRPRLQISIKMRRNNSSTPGSPAEGVSSLLAAAWLVLM